MLVTRFSKIMGLGLGVSAVLMADAAATESPFDHAYQVPVSQAAVFSVVGPATNGDVQGDAFLKSVAYPNSQVFTEFYRPVEVSRLQVAAKDTLDVRIRGGDHITEGVQGLQVLQGFAGGAPSADIPAFSEALKEVMASQNLNYYMDMMGAPDFSFVIGFDRPVRDDAPDVSDARGELLYLERGTNGGNSWLTMQAVDADGNALGPALAISPEETFPTSPLFSILNSTQQLGGLAIDVSRLGVSQVQYLKLSRSSAAHAGFEPLAIGGIDFQPDFKIQAVITHPADLFSLSYD